MCHRTLTGAPPPHPPPCYIYHVDFLKSAPRRQVQLFPYSDRALRFLLKKLPEVTELVMWQMQTQLCSQPDALMPPYSNTGEEEKRAPKAAWCYKGSHSQTPLFL